MSYGFIKALGYKALGFRDHSYVATLPTDYGLKGSGSRPVFKTYKVSGLCLCVCVCVCVCVRVCVCVCLCVGLRFEA